MGRTKEMAMDETPCTTSSLMLNAKLNRKIQECARAIGKIDKDGTNKFSNYQYITNDQMVTSLRSHLLDCGLSIVPSVISFDERDWTDNKGKLVIRSTVNMAFQITDLDTGFSIMESFVGAEQDNGGKSLQQAITQCTKYFYFKLFNVTSKDEIDGDANTNSVDAPKQVKKLTNANVTAILGQSDEYKIDVCNKIESRELGATTAQYNTIKKSISI
jgi:hypothetical protein